MNGALGGAISGGISGGMSAMQSTYERNVIFGNYTRAGKVNNIDNVARSLNAYENGLEKIIYHKRKYKSPNGEARAIIDGREVDSAVGFEKGGAGTPACNYGYSNFSSFPTIWH